MLYIIVIVLERILFNSLNIKIKKFSKMYFNKSNGLKSNKEEYIKICNPSKVNYAQSLFNTKNNNKNYDKIYLQYEDNNYKLIFKFLLSNIFLVSTHIFIFFYLPMRGNININFKIYCNNNNYYLNNSNNEDNKDIDFERNKTILCNDFHYNKTIVVFYLIHVIYYFYSSKQIKSGMLDFKKTSNLMNKTSTFYYVIFKIYKAIPFLYEIKLSIDWTFTSTSLDLFQWIKLESAHDMLFNAKCYAKSYKYKVLGNKIKKLEKLIYGLSFFLFLMILIIGPILLFSSLNPTNEVNNVEEASISIYLKFVEIKGSKKQENIKSIRNSINMDKSFIIDKSKNEYKDNDILTQEYNIYSSDLLNEKRLINENDFKNYKLDSSSKTNNFPRDQIQLISFSSVSYSDFSIPKPHFNNIINSLKKDEIDTFIVIKYRFKRKVN